MRGQAPLNRFIEAVLILSGMIIGVGMFGIPFSFVRAGFWLGTLELVILTGVVLLMHLLYGEIALKTAELHRMPGYIRIYLGRRAFYLAWASAVFGILGALLAYLVVGAGFLLNIAGPFAPPGGKLLFAAVMAVLGAAATAFSLKREAFINGILTSALVLFIIFLTAVLFPKIEIENLSGFNFREIFLPYGILLFALSGGTVIPDLITVLGRDRTRTRRAIVIGSLIPAALYFLFALGVVGVSGPSTSEEAISGLRAVAGNGVIYLGSLIGFLAVFTSYIVLSGSFQALLRLDFGLSRLFSWAAAALVPFFLYLTGFQSFILVISAVGAIAGGIDSALILAAHYKMRRDENAAFYFSDYAWRGAILVIMVLGVVYELAFLL